MTPSSPNTNIGLARDETATVTQLVAKFSLIMNEVMNSEVIVSHMTALIDVLVTADTSSSFKNYTKPGTMDG